MHADALHSGGSQTNVLRKGKGGAEGGERALANKFAKSCFRTLDLRGESLTALCPASIHEAAMLGLDPTCMEQ